jgi:hypothetical protein
VHPWDVRDFSSTFPFLAQQLLLQVRANFYFIVTNKINSAAKVIQCLFSASSSLVVVFASTTTATAAAAAAQNLL